MTEAILVQSPITHVMSVEVGTHWEKQNKSFFWYSFLQVYKHCQRNIWRGENNLYYPVRATTRLSDRTPYTNVAKWILMNVGFNSELKW